MAQKTIIIDGSKNVKTLNPWDVDDMTGWVDLNGTSDILKGYLVPTMFAAQSLYGKSFADIPFCIYDAAGNEIDNSDEYKNVTGALPDPFSFLWLTGSSLFTYGSSYWYKAKGKLTGKARDMQYFIPSTVTANFDTANSGELIDFSRNNKKYKPVDEIVYTWWIDPTVEDGPPNAYPFKSAALAAGISQSMFAWLTDFMERGATKATLLAVKGTLPKDERERIETYWNKFMRGLKNLGAWRVFNADSITPQIIGDGLADLKNVTITKDVQNEILIAAGIPASLILANSANYATANQDARNFYTNTVMPIARLFQGVLNTQLFKPYNVTIHFEPERLEVFQTDEAEKMASIASLLDVFSKAKPEAVLWAMDVIGYSLTEEQKAAMLAMGEDEEPEPVSENENNQPEVSGEVEEMPEEEPDEDEPAMRMFDIDTIIAASHELDVCQDKALKALEKGVLDKFAFKFFETPDEICQVVERQLLGVSDADGVKAAISEARRVLKYTEVVLQQVQAAPDYAPMLAGIEQAVKALEIADKPAPKQEPMNITIHNHPGEKPEVNVKYDPTINMPPITIENPKPEYIPPTIVVQPSEVVVQSPAVNVSVTAPTPDQVDILRDSNNMAKSLKVRK